MSHARGAGFDALCRSTIVRPGTEEMAQDDPEMPARAREAEELMNRMGLVCLKRAGEGPEGFAVALAPRDPAGPLHLYPRWHADPVQSIRQAAGPAEVLPDSRAVLAAGWLEGQGWRCSIHS